MTQILPDCMVPDGADPCLAYQQIVAERDALRALLAELRRLEQWRDDDDRELMACRARVDAALREATPAA